MVSLKILVSKTDAHPFSFFMENKNNLIIEMGLRKKKLEKMMFDCSDQELTKIKQQIKVIDNSISFNKLL